MIKNMSRRSNDATIKNLAENVKNLPARMEASLTNPPGSSSSTLRFTNLPLPQLDPNNYPNVKMWFPGSYKDIRKTGKTVKEDNEGRSHACQELDAKKDVGERPKSSILSSYMEDKDGNEVPEKIKDAVRKEAKLFFNLLLENGRAPIVWGDASIDVSNELVHALETKFEFLRLCDDHWKALQVATNSYSQWHVKAIGRKTTALKNRVDGEVIDVDADVNGDRPSKRAPAENNDTRQSKRPRVEGTQSAPSRPRPTKVTTQRRRVRKLFYYDYMRH